MSEYNERSPAVRRTAYWMSVFMSRWILQHSSKCAIQSPLSDALYVQYWAGQLHDAIWGIEIVTGNSINCSNTQADTVDTYWNDPVTPHDIEPFDQLRRLFFNRVVPVCLQATEQVKCHSLVCDSNKKCLLINLTLRPQAPKCNLGCRLERRRYVRIIDGDKPGIKWSPTGLASVDSQSTVENLLGFLLACILLTKYYKSPLVTLQHGWCGSLINHPITLVTVRGIMRRERRTDWILPSKALSWFPEGFGTLIRSDWNYPKWNANNRLQRFTKAASCCTILQIRHFQQRPEDGTA